MSGSMISFAGGGRTFQGYLAPSESGPGPGVILIQEWWGLVGHIKAVADRLSAEGFTVLAPDFYHGRAASEPDEAGSLMMALNIDEAGQVLQGAVSRVLEDPATAGSRAGAAGFCMGGQLALFAACLDPRIGAAVDFYGIHPRVEPDLASLHAPLLGLFAELDDYASPASVQALSDRLKELGKEHEFHTYPGAQHAFFNDERPEVFHPEAAADAWTRTIAHFRSHL